MGQWALVPHLRGTLALGSGLVFAVDGNTNALLALKTVDGSTRSATA
jgi:hypothetical protein